MPRIQANGIEIFYDQAGEGVPLIVQGHHHIPWMVFQVPYFSQFYRVITFDRRGTGRSASPSGDWTIADFAADLKGLLDALEIDKAIIAGASLGGVIACQFGLDYPDRALALVIGHTVPYFREDSKIWVDEQIKEIEVEQAITADASVTEIAVTLLAPDGSVLATGTERVDQD